MRKSDSAQRQESSERKVREAERLLAIGEIQGAQALKVRALVEQAKSSRLTGQTTEAERLARQAVREAREEDNYTPGSAGPMDTAEGEPPGPAHEPDGTLIQTDSTEQPPLSQPESSVYQDRSEDGGVSMKMGAPVTDLQAPLAVRSHETSHLLHEIQDAVLEGRPVQASVRILSRIDPESGEQYVAGGRAYVTLFANTELAEPQEPSFDIQA